MVATLAPIPPPEMKSHSEALAEYMTADMQAMVISDDEELQIVANIINDIKARASALDELEKSVTAPILQGVERYRALFRPAKAAAQHARGIYDQKVRTFLLARGEAQAAAEAALQDAVAADDAPAAAAAVVALVPPARTAGLVVQNAWNYEEFNHDIVPTSLTLLHPAAVRTEIKRQLAEGMREPAIPGLRIFKSPIIKGVGK